MISPVMNRNSHAKDLVQFITTRPSTLAYRHEERRPRGHAPGRDVQVA